MAPTIFIKFCGFIVHSNLNNMTLSAVPGKSLKLKKYFFIFYSSHSVATKLTDYSASNSIFRVPLEVSPARFFNIFFKFSIRRVA